MTNIKVLKSKFLLALTTQIRDQSAQNQLLRTNLNKLGEKIGEEIIGEMFTTSTKIQTPMDLTFEGMRFSIPTTVILSTRDDYNYFGKGIASLFDGGLRGFMDFAGLRGPSTLKSEIAAVELPKIPQGRHIENVIIAKSVLATGCTAISLAQKAIETYRPRNIIVASVFYSNRGIEELMMDIYPQPVIFVVGEPDTLNADGMLIPGVGDIDKRIS
jgi:uracil phosphoribosyltransferase